MRWRGFALLAVLAASSAGLDLGDAYLAAIGHADSLYQAGHYRTALESYESALDLLPTEPGPLVGIGWTRLRMGDYPEAESAFRRMLATRPEQPTVRQGLALLPVRYRLKLTLSVTGARDSARMLAGFVEYSHYYRTTVAFGFQTVDVRKQWQGFNTALVVYHRLEYPWSARFDFYTLSSARDPRYWRIVYAPAVGRRFGDWAARATLIGWDWFGTAGLQLSVQRTLGFGLNLEAAPAANLIRGKYGWLVPVTASYPVLPWLTLKAGAGYGSIADHVDLEIATFYTQAERLIATARAGLDATVLKRYRVAGFAAWERYGNRTGLVYVSLTLSVRL
jgi:hypothetical protein